LLMPEEDTTGCPGVDKITMLGPEEEGEGESGD
jgi:hypothetical protein